MTILLVMAISMTGYSNYAYADVDTSPDLISATPVVGGDVDLVWTQISLSNGEVFDSYELWRHTSASFNPVEEGTDVTSECTAMTTDTTTTCTDTSGIDGTPYFYEIVFTTTGTGAQTDVDTAIEVTATPDSNSPTPTIGSVQTSPTNDATVNFTVDWDESVSDFDLTDIDVTGTAGLTTASNFAGSGTSYTFDVVVPVATEGTILIDIPDGVSDAVGNANDVPTTFSFTTDRVDPVITVTGNPIQLELGSVVPALDDNVSTTEGTIVIGNGAAVVTTVVSAGIIVTYDATDSVGNTANQKSRTYIVSDTTIPVLTPNQADPFELFVGDAVPTLDVTVSDNDSSVDGTVITCDMGGVSTANVGIDPAECDFTDPSGNDAVQYVYTVNISATAPTTPTSLSASLTVASEDSSVDLTWTAPSSDGGSTIWNCNRRLWNINRYTRCNDIIYC